MHFLYNHTGGLFQSELADMRNLCRAQRGWYDAEETAETAEAEVLHNYYGGCYPGVWPWMKPASTKK